MSPRYTTPYDAQLAVLCYSDTKRQLEAIARVKYLTVSDIVRKVLYATIPSLIKQFSEDEKRAFDTILESDNIVEELEELITRSDDERERERPSRDTEADEPDPTDSIDAESPSQF